MKLVDQIMVFIELLGEFVWFAVMFMMVFGVVIMSAIAVLTILMTS